MYKLRLKRWEAATVVNQVALKGIVLSAAPHGEYDKRLVVLTGQRGKITVFVKGAKRPSNRFAAMCQPFAFGDFVLYQGKEAYNLVDASISNYFDNIVKDMDAVYYGFYFLELADYYSHENVFAKDMVNLLYVSLKALVNKNIPIKLVRYIYELKMFAINGEYPDVFQCAYCGNKEGLAGFLVEKSGAVCCECIEGSVKADANVRGNSNANVPAHACAVLASMATKNVIRLNTSTFYTMQYIISSPIEKLYSFTVTDEVLTELSMVMGRFSAGHIDRQFKSLEFIL